MPKDITRKTSEIKISKKILIGFQKFPKILVKTLEKFRKFYYFFI